MVQVSSVVCEVHTKMPPDARICNRAYKIFFGSIKSVTVDDVSIRGLRVGVLLE